MTNKTERLRELLDECGVRWWPDMYYKDTNTCWMTGGFEWRASEHDGDLIIGGTYTKCVTPEQAIEVTVERGMCHDVSEPPKDCAFWPSPHFRCSECGATHVSLEYVRYCPNCGRKVV